MATVTAKIIAMPSVSAIVRFMSGRGSIVLLKNNLLTIEAQLFEDSAYVVDHFLQPANVNVQIAAIADGFQQVGLYVPGAAGPGSFGTAERGPKTEIRICAGQRLKIVAIVNGVFMANAEDQC